MDHEQAIAAIPKDRRAALTTRSDAAGLLHLAGHFGALGLTGTGIVLAVPAWPLLLVPHGVLLVFLFTLSHECTHRTPFRSRWLNEVTGHALAPLIALPFLWFRYFHLAHHRFTNLPGQDPKLEGGGHPTNRRDWGIYLSGWRYWTGAARVLWAHAFGGPVAPYLPLRRHRAMRIEARVILGVYILVALCLTINPILF